MSWASRCNVHAAAWHVPMLGPKTVGSAIPIQTLKKNEKRRSSANFYRRSQFPAGLYSARYLESGGTRAGGPRHGATQERKDSRCNRTVGHTISLPAGTGLQCLDLFGMPRTTCRTVSAPRSDFDSGWRLLSQERGGGELVRYES